MKKAHRSNSQNTRQQPTLPRKTFPNKCKDFTETPNLYNKLIINILQYPLFCIAKVPVLHAKSAYIATQNSRFCNVKSFPSFLLNVFFTKPSWLFLLKTILSLYLNVNKKWTMFYLYIRIHKPYIEFISIDFNKSNSLYWTCLLVAMRWK